MKYHLDVEHHQHAFPDVIKNKNFNNKYRNTFRKWFQINSKTLILSKSLLAYQNVVGATFYIIIIELFYLLTKFLLRTLHNSICSNAL